MMRSRLITIVVLAGLAAPITGIAQTYLTPEEVLQENNGIFLIPGHQRGAQWAADYEAQLSINRHPSIVTDPFEQARLNALLPTPVATEDPQDFAPLDPSDPSLVNPYQGLDPTTARLLARLAQQNSILASMVGNSGAPLSQTGPAAVLIVLVMAAATILTLRRARGLERLVKEI